jgi:CPA1 family monovalent cation:H+ antiporter
MSPTTRIVVYNFWEYAGFIANSFIFLLIGMQIHLPVLYQNWQSILWAILAVSAARAIAVYGLSLIEKDIPIRWRHVLFWGGLRGAISLALALSLPALLPQASNQLQAMAFGVVLFSLLVQGFSMKPLVTRLKLSERSEFEDEYERRHARAVASRHAYEHLKRQHSRGLLSDHTWRRVGSLLNEHNRSLANAVREVMSADPKVESEELDTARREYLRAQRSVINTLRRDGTITDEVHTQLLAEIDAAITSPRKGWPELVGVSSSPTPAIKRLMAAVIQDQDMENALGALTKLGIPTTRLPSTGGFFGRNNATLLIGLEEGQEAGVVKALEKSCRRRVEYVASPIEGFLGGLAEPIQVTVGGATVFIFEVERFETF